MKINNILLQVSDINKQRAFYKALGFSILESTKSEFTIHAGWTTFKFIEGNIDYKYHYCYLIPMNHLDDSIRWLKERTDVIRIDKERVKQKFDSWHAESVYFIDGVGNLAEFKVHYNFDNSSNLPFSEQSIIGVHEIGCPSDNIVDINSALERIGSPFWKGDMERFGTNGDMEGIFLLVNNLQKKTWFPTPIPTQSSPFECSIQVNNENFSVVFDPLSRENRLQIKKI